MARLFLSCLLSPLSRLGNAARLLLLDVEMTPFPIRLSFQAQHQCSRNTTHSDYYQSQMHVSGQS